MILLDAAGTQAAVLVRVQTFTLPIGNTSASFTQTITGKDTNAPVLVTAAGSLDATIECSDAAGLSAARSEERRVGYISACRWMHQLLRVMKLFVLALALLYVRARNFD